MKKYVLILLFCITTIMGTQAQFINYIRISGDVGFTANSLRDEKLGVSGGISWLTSDNLFSLNENNFITLGVKGFNNPYGEGKILSSIMNGKNDGFNYIMTLVGYRITLEGIENGFFVEPRFGAAFGSSYNAFALSPLAGYAFSSFDLSIYCDMGFGNDLSAIQKKNFFTPGISIAYSFRL